MYGNFAGRDASRGMAKQSFDIGTHPSLRVVSTSDSIAEMLTPVDQPLDKLEDLTPEEMLAFSFFLSLFANANMILFLSSENMKGWIEHFSNKYIICGRLVENVAGES
jgi:membrane-associated progesterone receptor component